jgi:conjugative relaxase-like TrwC/TraI family protein
MMTVAPIQDAGKASKYFQGRAGESRPGEYYLTAEGKGEPAGQWHDAAALGLAGTITGARLQSVMEGRDPQSGEMLVRAGRGHRPGWDCTLTCPKSVSAIWAVAPPELCRRIEAAHAAAVQETKQYLDDRAGYTRRGHGGADREQVRLTAAEYRHSTNRNDEPHLHSHLLVMNLAKRTDGSWGTIESRYIMQHQMAAGTIYHLSLADRLQRMGFVIEPDKSGTFRVGGVPQAVIRQWSSRHQEIVDRMEKEGVVKTQGKAAEIVFNETRRSKTYADPAVLRVRWLEQAGALGWTPAAVQTLLTRETRTEPPAPPHIKPPRWKDLGEEKSLIRELGARMYGRAAAADVRALAEQICRDWQTGRAAGRELAWTASRTRAGGKPPARRLDEETRQELRIRLAGLGKKIPHQAPGEKLPDAAWREARDTAAWLTQASPVLAGVADQAVAAAVQAGRTPEEARRYVEAGLAGNLARVAGAVAQSERRGEILDLAVGPAWKGRLDGPTARIVRQAVQDLRSLPARERGQAVVQSAGRILDSPAVRPLADEYSSHAADPARAGDKLTGQLAAGLLAAADYTDRRGDALAARGVAAALTGLMQTVRQEELAAERLAAEEAIARAKQRQLETELMR